MKMKKIKNISTVIFCLSFAIWLFAINHNDAISMAPSHVEDKLQNEFSGLAKITDGDTIKIAEKKIRLLYIDAPESKQTCFDTNYNEYLCGVKSTEFLTNLIANDEVKCFYDKLDKYGRYLSECYVRDLSINNELVKNGMAVTYFFGHVNTTIAQSEEGARSKKIGIWQGAFELPKDYRKTHQRKTQANTNSHL